MANFNIRLVESLDVLNHVLAVIFTVMAAYRFFDIVGDNFFAALFESLTVLGLGILTCGYIALMIHIKDLLQRILDKQF